MSAIHLEEIMKHLEIPEVIDLVVLINRTPVSVQLKNIHVVVSFLLNSKAPFLLYLFL